MTAETGTGIVHQAPGFGDDDHRIAIAHGILTPEEQPPCPIDDAGNFTSEVTDFAGEYIKVSGLYYSERSYTQCFDQTADSKIQKMLKAKGRLIVQSNYMHSYPFCWRSVLYFVGL